MPTIVEHLLSMGVQLYETQRRFNRACDQSASQHQATVGLKKRYQSARSNDYKIDLRFPLRLRFIMIEEGLVKQYYHYADMKRNEILHLRSQLNQDDDVESDELISDDDL